MDSVLEMGLLLPVERCPALSHEFSCLGRGVPGGPGLGDDAEFVLDHLGVAGWSAEAGADALKTPAIGYETHQAMRRLSETVYWPYFVRRRADADGRRGVSQ